jgi:ABC-type multidrug transport system fused ATPase/permease subunit
MTTPGLAQPQQNGNLSESTYGSAGTTKQNEEKLQTLSQDIPSFAIVNGILSTMTSTSGKVRDAVPPEKSSFPSSVPEARRRSSVFSQNDISLREVTPIDILVKGLSITVEHKHSPTGRLQRMLSTRRTKNDTESGISNLKSILTNISAHFPSGTLTAIMGSSGSGKTSL